MPRKPGQPIDLALVNQVKTLHRLKKTRSEISQQCGISKETVSRYLKRPDQEGDEERRDMAVDHWVEQADRVADILLDRIEKAALDEEIKPKDLIVMWGVTRDKLTQNQVKPQDRKQLAVVNFTFVCPPGTNSRIISDSGEVSYIDGPVSGDGLRPGGGEDLLGMLGSGEEKS